jgi:hypothetical protein
MSVIAELAIVIGLAVVSGAVGILADVGWAGGIIAGLGFAAGSISSWAQERRKERG